MTAPASSSSPSSCDLCGGEPWFICEDRGLLLCADCVKTGGRLGAVEHDMPGGQTVCVHRRRDSLAVKFGAGYTVLYRKGGPG